jgi:formylglycine-generating enzyme required for sulfatase activity
MLRVDCKSPAGIVCAAALAMAVASPALGSDTVDLGPIIVDRTEVTIGQFRAFLSARGVATVAERDGGGFEFTGGWTRRPGWTWAAPYGKAGSDREPAVHVSWTEARDYCRHANGRLPTFGEWRLAAYTELRDQPDDGFQTGRTYAYPVGDTPEGMNTSRRSHVEACTTKRGVNGLYDMGANVWEWLADNLTSLPGYQPHPLYPDYSAPYVDDQHQMMLGGSWITSGTEALRYYRNWFRPHFYQHAGFRIVQDL